MVRLSAFNRRIPPSLSAKPAVRAFDEDFGKGDATAEAVLGRAAYAKVRAFIRANRPGVLAGVLEAAAVFKAAGVAAKPLVKEGTAFRKGRKLIVLTGNAGGILAAERTALDCLMVLSGIATETRALSRRFGRRIAATRKSHPGFSAAEKRAVQVGGGLTHRLSLSDAILVKDNYVEAIARHRKISYTAALRWSVRQALAFRERGRGLAFVEVEVRNRREALAAAEAGARAILLDNMRARQVGLAVKAVRRIHPGIVIEASGGITPKNAGKFLAAGADFASIGSLTLHSRPIDMSLVLDLK
ncbi:MAG: carboxylating nicotinate-nucleotide diphosphorylase [Candidatus Micrarchaeota archaeon]